VGRTPSAEIVGFFRVNVARASKGMTAAIAASDESDDPQGTRGFDRTAIRDTERLAKLPRSTAKRGVTSHDER